MSHHHWHGGQGTRKGNDVRHTVELGRIQTDMEIGAQGPCDLAGYELTKLLAGDATDDLAYKVTEVPVMIARG